MDGAGFACWVRFFFSSFVCFYFVARFAATVRAPMKTKWRPSWRVSLIFLFESFSYSPFFLQFVVVVVVVVVDFGPFWTFSSFFSSLFFFFFHVSMSFGASFFLGSMVADGRTRLEDARRSGYRVFTEFYRVGIQFGRVGLWLTGFHQVVLDFEPVLLGFT